MALKIPKIEYLNTTKNGTTSNGGSTITGLNVTGLQYGMTVMGAGIPVGSKVISVGATSVTIDTVMTASATVSISFSFVIELDYQPIEKKGNQLDASENISVSISGIRQVSVNYLEENRSLILAFLSQDLFVKVEAFFKNHACYGRDFRYYEDKTSVSYISYELSKLAFNPEKVVPKGEDQYIWNVPLAMRRAL